MYYGDIHYLLKHNQINKIRNQRGKQDGNETSGLGQKLETDQNKGSKNQSAENICGNSFKIKQEMVGTELSTGITNVPASTFASATIRGNESNKTERKNSLKTKYQDGRISSSLNKEQSYLDGTFLGGWQSNEDIPVRREVIVDIVKLITNTKPVPRKVSAK